MVAGPDTTVPAAPSLATFMGRAATAFVLVAAGVDLLAKAPAELLAAGSMDSMLALASDLADAQEWLAETKGQINRLEAHVWGALASLSPGVAVAAGTAATGEG